MSHEIEQNDAVLVRDEQAWHGLGHVVKENQSAVVAAREIGLTWPVDQDKLIALNQEAELALGKCRVSLAVGEYDAARAAFDAFAKHQIPVTSHVANVRNDNGDRSILGIVGSSVQVCQNQQLAEFTDSLSDSGQVVIESCGSLRGGKRVWFLARGEGFTVGSDTDKVYPYICVSNGHDGSQSIRVTPTTVRVVCSNTLHMVIPREEGTQVETAAITIQHTGDIKDKLESARASLRHYQSTLARNRELFEALAAKKIDESQAIELFAGAYASNFEVATPEDLKAKDDRIRQIAQNRYERMVKAKDLFLARYQSEIGTTGNEDSAWAYMNALTGYFQHDRTVAGKDDADRANNKIESNLFGSHANRSKEALAATTALLAD